MQLPTRHALKRGNTLDPSIQSPGVATGMPRPGRAVRNLRPVAAQLSLPQEDGREAGTLLSVRVPRLPIRCQQDAALTPQMERVVAPLWDSCNTSASRCLDDS